MAHYTFGDSYDMPMGKSKKGKHHRRQKSGSSEISEEDNTDGNGSLTYSAASSINSAAGESTDSSLAGIMKVLDVHDSKELAAVLEKERIKSKHHHPTTTDRSVAGESQNSMTYSKDGESHMGSLATEQTGQSGLAGTKLLGTIAGQTSDQFSYDGGNYQPNHGQPHGSAARHSDADDLNLLFAPAEHADTLKRRKEQKRRERKDRQSASTSIDNQTPRVKNSKKTAPAPHDDFGSSRSSPEKHSGSRSSPNSKRPPKVSRESLEMQEEEDVWYAKWWMFCFPDTVKTMTPKR